MNNGHRGIHVSPHSIAAHYDRCSWWYWKLWGEHIHHGLWKADESANQAQTQLVERLAEAAGIASGATVLDAGCGLAGSSIWLARERACHVTGITLSGVQARIGQKRVAVAGLGARVRIQRGDLEELSWPTHHFDAVWAIESTEHFHDKGRFFRRAAEWLRPGGVLALCAWTPADGLAAAEWQRHIRPVCRGFLCPSLASPGEYRNWLEEAGLVVAEQTDLTAQTLLTWDQGMERTNRLWVRVVALLLGPETWRFLRSFPAIRDAYRRGALRYTLLTARKPLAPGHEVR